MQWWEIGYMDWPKPIEIERFTDDSVWINGRRNKRITSWAAYYPTIDEALGQMERRLKTTLDSAERTLNRAQVNMAEFQKRRAAL
jgi:hypothetical protein